VAADPAATGNLSTRRFQALSIGNTEHDFAVGSGDPHELAAATAATTVATRTILILSMSAAA
jgi:hypothetical protein